MQQIILIILAAVFISAVIKQVLFWSWLWQLKEYRWDRLRAHFQDIGFKSAILAMIGYSSIKQSKFPKFTLKTIFVDFFSFLFIVGALVLAIRVYMPQIFMAINSLENLYAYKFNILSSPISIALIKNLIIAVAGLLGDYAIIAEIMAALFILAPIIIYLIIVIFNVFSGIYKRWIINKAKRKISGFVNLKVVGITGSFGKSTTKEILADILSKRYKVLKTPANINTAIGIAQLILRELDEKHEVFVVEMGAYKIGEIREICEMVKPKIGIITAINEQHLALFGKIDNTIKAKFELVDSLPKDGLAILNIGDANIQAGVESRSLSSGAIRSRVRLYSVGAKSDVYAIGEASDRKNIKFKYISGANMKDFTLNILGAHNISNALAAIIAAEELHMNLDKVSQILQKINYLDIGLKKLAGPNGSILIDDTYNSNSDGVFAALRHIKSQRGRKIIIMSSLIELGKCAHKIHQELGKEISKIASKVFFLDNYYISDIIKGASANSESDIEIRNEKKPKKVSEYLKNELKPNDTVLFINRGSRKVLDLLEK